MADGVVAFGIQKLWELLGRESERLHGVHEQVAELKRQLRMLQSLLKDAYARKHDSERVRNFLEDVIDIVYDAEDMIEIFLLSRRKENGIKKQVKRLACVLVDRRKIASDVDGMIMRISEVIGQMKSFGIQEIIDGNCLLPLQDIQMEIRQTFHNNSDINLVGVEQSVEELVGHLVDNNNIQVVSISGMGGIGKTTLARQVFHHDMIRRHFKGFAWVCVSKQFTRKEVWRRVLQDLRPHDVDILQMEEYTLHAELFQLLEADRHLIVLDDVWNNVDWNRIKTVFPHKRGWKILLTSRNEGVGLHADPMCVSFRPRSLTPEHSWTLCQLIAFPRRDEIEFRVDKELEVLGKEMLIHCGGLPLAVKVLGGLLASKHTISEWKRVYDSIGPQIVAASGLEENNPDSIFRLLSLSYEDLPMHLKDCFLYLAYFPKDYKINVKTLFNCWAAEGIIMPCHDGATIQDSAEGYLEELVKRNMVIAERNYSTLRFDKCQMHDIMREVCLYKAKEENFLQIIKVPTSTPTVNAQLPIRSRRLVVHSNNTLQMLRHKDNRKVRALFIFSLHEDLLIQSASYLGSLTLLRVLNLTRAKFQGGKLPSSIGDLVHLRFLSLHEARVSHLPSSLRNLRLLLYLNLLVDGEFVHVPNVLKDMLQLRYLYLPLSMHEKTNLELSDLVNLEALWFFSTKHSSVIDLLQMTRLRTLSVCFTGGCSYETLSSPLSELRDLEQLSLLDMTQDTSLADGGEFVLDFIHLNHLSVSMRMPRLPDQHQFPPNLAHICLTYCCMEEDPMPILGKLLHLKWVELSHGAFAGRRMVCSNGGFPLLHELKLFRQKALEEWIVEDGSMPRLCTLTIYECKKLKELPDGIKHITFLKELKIANMKRKWKVQLSAGGESYHKVQHIPDVQLIRCDEEGE